MKEEVEEIWVVIPEYTNYSISNYSRVINNKNGQILKPGKNTWGYFHLNLSKDNKQKTFLLHRLVAESFIPNPDNKPEIDHINTIRTDNRLENLRWVTRKENRNNPITIISHINKQSKSILQFSKYGEFIKEWKSAIEVENTIGINNSSISQCCQGKRKSSGNFIWKYSE